MIALIKRLQMEKKLPIPDRIKTFYNFSTIRKYLLITKLNVADGFQMILDDIVILIFFSYNLNFMRAIKHKSLQDITSILKKY